MFNITDIVTTFSNKWDDFKKQVMDAFIGLSNSLNNLESITSDNVDGVVSDVFTADSSSMLEGDIVGTIILPRSDYSMIDLYFSGSGSDTLSNQIKIFPKHKGTNNFILYSTIGTSGSHYKGRFCEDIVPFSPVGINDDYWSFKFELNEEKLNIYYISCTGDTNKITINISGCCFR